MCVRRALRSRRRCGVASRYGSRIRDRRSDHRHGSQAVRTGLIRGLGYPAGRFAAGTSGFSYPGWSPRFFPADLPDSERLVFYGSRLGVVELNNTFYQRPTAARIDAWCAAVPNSFRFVTKAQRGGSLRALSATAGESVGWLTERLPGFADRLGAVLLTVPDNAHRRPDGSSDESLGRLLEFWPRTIPLVIEFSHPSWHVDETFNLLRAAGAVLCATDLPERDGPPDIRVTGTGLYLRLRRHDYSTADLETWAARIQPFLDAGHPALAFFRHDESGRAAELAAELNRLLGSG